MEFNLKHIYKFIMIILILIPVFVFVFLLNKKVVLWGDFVVEYDFSSLAHPFISGFTPKERAGIIQKDEQGVLYQVIKGEPVYFEIETPKSFKNISLEIKYKNDKVKDFKIGTLIDKKGWKYKLKSVENKILEDKIKEWPSIRNKDVILIERSKNFNTIDEFLANLPKKEEISIYNYDLKVPFQIENYKPNNDFLEVNNLKGYHQFYTYLKDEPLNFFMEFQDLKNKDDYDKNRVLEVNIYSYNKLVFHKDLGEYLNGDKININEYNLSEGAYKVEIKVDDDIIIKTIKTKLQFIAFINKIYIVKSRESLNNNIVLYSDSPAIRISTADISALQRVTAENISAEIDDIYKQFLINGYECKRFIYMGESNCLSEIRLEDSGLLIQGDGLFSFSRESFLNSEIKSLDKLKKLDGINYILANYSQPQISDNGWKVATLDFKLDDAIRENRKYKFIVSLPSLAAGQEIYVASIKANFFKN